jgi:ADP-ribose pyrophosphatase YjhB (NUDIX family)
MINKDLLEGIKKIKAIADTGLLYSSNPYEKDRCLELQKICFDLLNKVSGHSVEELKTVFPLVKDYPTVKVDVRGLILSEDKKILFIKESVDNKWALPGGWADIGCTPKEVVIKECKEEAGLDVVVKNLLAVYDKRMHAHPPQPFYIYKLMFYCEAISFEVKKGFDVLDVKYFDINDLPELSEDRILKSQVEMLYKKILSKDFETYFD